MFSHGRSSERSNATAMSSALMVVFCWGFEQRPVQPWTVWPGGRIATTVFTPLMYLNVYSASSSASRRSSSSRLDEAWPTPIEQFVLLTPQRL